MTKARIAQLEERLEEAQEKCRETENQVQALLFSLNINSYSSSFCCLSLPLFYPPSPPLKVKQLKHSVHCYEGEVRVLKQEKKEAELRVAGMVGKEEMQLMKDRHKVREERGDGEEG